MKNEKLWLAQLAAATVGLVRESAGGKHRKSRMERFGAKHLRASRRRKRAERFQQLEAERATLRAQGKLLGRWAGHPHMKTP
jgi:hypothetical protein